MTKLDSILKSKRHYFINTGPSSQGYSFSSDHARMWELDNKESWAPKNWCFWTVVLEKTLESPLHSRRSNQSILKEVSPGCSLEGLILKLKLQYFGRLMWRADSFEKTLMLAKIEGRRRRGWQRMRWLDGITNSMHMGLGRSWWWTARPGVLQFMGLQRVGHDWATEWTELRYYKAFFSSQICFYIDQNVIEITCPKKIFT